MTIIGVGALLVAALAYVGIACLLVSAVIIAGVFGGFRYLRRDRFDA